MMLMLRQYNGTKVIIIVKYRQSIAFGNISIAGHFSVAREWEI